MKKRKALKLKTILILLMALMIFAAIGISGMISFQLFERSMVDKIGDSRVDVLFQISEKISAVKSNAELLSNLYFYNENLTSLYHPEGYSQEEIAGIQENFSQIETLSEMTMAASELNFYYTFLMKNGYVYSSDYDASFNLEEYENQLWYPEVMENGEAWVSTYKDKEQKDVISIARSLKSETGEVIGLFLFNIYEKNFCQTYLDLVENNDIYIVDSKGNIVSHENEDLLGIRFYDMELLNMMFQDESSLLIEKMQKQYLFSIVRNQALEWILVEEIPKELLMEDVKAIRTDMILAGGLIFFAGMLVCLVISYRTTRPLGALVHELESVGRSESVNQEFSIKGWSEIHKICEECNYMTARIRSLVEAIKESEKKKRVAEIGFMQSQMRPHFLYNTLFSIRCMVDMGDEKKAIGIIDSFTSILKYILSYKSEFVEVAREIKFLEDYSALQKYRYGNQFDLTILCEPELYEKKILRMILEPLVENSLFHGMSDEKQEIHVQVHFQIVDGDLLITVVDDGIGFTEEHYQYLSEKIRDKKQSNLIGMNNIRNRIKETFGKKYGLSIDVNYDRGAKILVKLPVID
ncbi:MAG: sensor histidine kinase [Lachnospiraceae bacterium]